MSTKHLSWRSGLRRTAVDGLETVVKVASRTKLKILPGSGVNAASIPVILRALGPQGVREIHMSGGEFIESLVQASTRPEGMDMGGWTIWRTSESKIRAARAVVDALANEL